MAEKVDLNTLRRLALYGSPTARAAALVVLDVLSGGELLKELEKLGERAYELHKRTSK